MAKNLFNRKASLESLPKRKVMLATERKRAIAEKNRAENKDRVVLNDDSSGMSKNRRDALKLVEANKQFEASLVQEEWIWVKVEPRGMKRVLKSNYRKLMNRDKKSD